MKVLTFLIFLTIFGFSFGSLGKLQPCVLEALKTNSHVDILILFESPDQILKQIENNSFKNMDEKANTIAKELKIHSENCQKSILEFLKFRKTPAELKILRISNILWVKSADLKLIREIASKSEVTKIFEDGIVTLDETFIPLNQTLSSEIDQNPTISWGVTQIGAPDAWYVYGADGTGSKVGIVDTGVRGDHLCLERKFTGDWYDPYGISTTPTDGNGHGTHCTGTVLGSLVDGSRIVGVAPGAQWMASRGLDQNGSGSFSTLLDCLEWMFCPTSHFSGSDVDQDCSRRPNIVSCSWGGSSTTDDPYFNPIFKSMNSVNMLPVFAAGNSGPGCQTIGFPANMNTDTESPITTCGATDNNNVIAGFSSRGCAPGVSIVSSYNTGTNSYATASGTSMATPHVAGLFALMVAKYPNLSNDDIRSLVYATCFQPSTVPAGCDNPPGGWPNNIYGWGMVNATKVFEYAP